MPSFRQNMVKAARELVVPTRQQAIQAASVSGMDSTVRLGPGAPIFPADGIAEEPRGFNYPAGYNIASRPRSNERMSFDAMSGLINAWDIPAIAITHRIDSIRALKWSISPMEGCEDDVSAEVAYARQIMKKPDRQLPFSSWFSKWAWDVFAYDAGSLYRNRNNAGQATGLKVVDGRTLAPMIDQFGDRPTGSAPAYIQFISGTTWNWLLDEDIIYTPYRPMPDSTYGRPAIENIVLAASTNLRMQAYFLQKFTVGNVPAGFAIAPDTWGPDQIKAYQSAWDGQFKGNQEIKSLIRWVPGGTTFEFPDNVDFDVEAEQWFMQKAAAAYHVTPDSLGFVQDSNRSVGESQADVQQQVGDVPSAEYFAGILTDFLQDDVGLPVDFKFDLGGEEEDRLQTAQSDAIYMDHGVVSPSKVLELRFGITDTEQIPRYFANATLGPIPVADLLAASVPVDSETGAPEAGVVPPANPQMALEAGILTSTEVAPPAVPAAVAPVAKAETTGITSATGITGNPLKSAAEDDDETDPAEITKFQTFVRQRIRFGKWRDFEFRTGAQETARRLNVAGYAQFRKAANEIIAAGVAVMAADTGRVLMLQRALDPTDRAAGLWEFPGGCLEVGEQPDDAAAREWVEETGFDLPEGAWNLGWTSPSGLYQGFTLVVPSEFSLDGRVAGSNPDDPDGDFFESLAWWAPSALVGNPVIRPELAADASLVLGALVSQPYDRNALAVSVPTEDGDLDLTGEADAVPLAKASWRSTDKTPQHKYDLALTDHYQPLIQSVIADAISKIDVAAITGGLIAKADVPVPPPVSGDVLAAAVQQNGGIDLSSLGKLLEAVYRDSYAAGEHAAAVQLDPHVASVQGLDKAVVDTDWDTWTPGDPLAASQLGGGGLQDLLDNVGITIKGVGDSTINQIGNSLADGVNQGLSVQQMARNLTELGVSKSKSTIIAHTESTRAVMAATKDMYTSNGVTQFDWVISDDACDECVAQADGNPYDVGDDTPPLHPYCRCSTIPVVDSIDGDAIEVDDQSGDDEGDD